MKTQRSSVSRYVLSLGFDPKSSNYNILKPFCSIDNIILFELKEFSLFL